MKTRDELITEVKKINGKRRERIATEKDVDMILDEIASADEKTHTIRVYPNFAFVANSYKYRAETTYIHATREGDDWKIIVATCDAKRARGVGPKVTHNGR